MKSHGTFRTIGEMPTHGRYNDAFESQIMFEGWLANFSHLQELYLNNLCDIVFESDRIILRAKFTDKEWTIWCLKHPTPVAGR
jgi:hypothetical protein